MLDFMEKESILQVELLRGRLIPLIVSSISVHVKATSWKPFGGMPSEQKRFSFPKGSAFVIMA